MAAHIGRTSWAAVAVLVTSAALGESGSAGPGQHFHPKGKPPSQFTLALQSGRRVSLPFADQRDFEEARRGFIAAPPYKRVMAESGAVARDMESYEWLLQDGQFDSIHPSLQRQAILNMAYGLYQVVPGRVYQVRGFDLADRVQEDGDAMLYLFNLDGEV